MRFDNRPTDRQANPDAVRFRGVKTFEHPVGVLCVDAGAAVLNGDDDRTAFLETGFYRQHAPAAGGRDHRFYGVADQIEQHLLQLNGIAQNRRERYR